MSWLGYVFLYLMFNILLTLLIRKPLLKAGDAKFKEILIEYPFAERKLFNRVVLAVAILAASPLILLGFLQAIVGISKGGPTE